MRLDHLLSKEKCVENTHRSYWSVVIDGFRLMLFNFEGPFEKVDNSLYGGVAQLGEHLLCKQGVIGSIPFISTKLSCRVKSGKREEKHLPSSKKYGLIAQVVRAHA